MALYYDDEDVDLSDAMDDEDDDRGGVATATRPARPTFTVPRAAASRTTATLPPPPALEPPDPSGIRVPGNASGPPDDFAASQYEHEDSGRKYDDEDYLRSAMGGQRSAADRLSQVERERPQAPRPKLWQRILAGVAAGGVGYANAGGRVKHPVDPSGIANLIMNPNRGRDMADWQAKKEGAVLDVQLADRQAAQARQAANDTEQRKLREAQAEQAKAHADYYRKRSEMDAQDVWVVQKDGSLFNRRTGETQQMPKPLADQLKEKREAFRSAGYSDDEASFYAAGGKPGEYLRGNKEKEVSNPEQVLMNPSAYTKEQVATAQKLFAQKHRPPSTTIQLPGLGQNDKATTSSLHGEEFLALLPAPTAAQVRAIAEGRLDMPSSTSRGANAQLRNAVLAYDPQFNQQRAQIRKAFVQGKEGQNIGALNTAAAHMDQLHDAMVAMDNGSFVPGNELYNAVKRTFGNAAPTNFDSLKNAVAGEMANALKGQATDVEIRNISNAISSANSPQQLEGAVRENMKILATKLGTYQERYRQYNPTDEVWTPILPTARRAFDKFGALGSGSGSVVEDLVKKYGGR